VPDPGPVRPGPPQRLRQRADFVAAAKGNKLAGSGFVLQMRKRDDNAPARMGFTVSKKVGSAVERNRVRRRLKEVVNRTAPNRVLRGHDYVLVGQRAALTLPFSELVVALASALERVQNAASGLPGNARDRSKTGAGRAADER
jgi:ribonuclease P protein component